MARKSRHQHAPSQRLLIVMPQWLGETVMATPTVRALRDLYPQAEITALTRRHLKPVLECDPAIDRFITVHRRKDGHDQNQMGPLRLARQLAKGRFDTAVLLPNGFKSALLVRTAGIKRRVGYDRDGRGGLLTDRLLPRRATGRYVPVPTIDYFLGIPRYLGATHADPRMILHTSDENETKAQKLLRDHGWTDKSGRPLVIVSPGALYGPAKTWDAGHFAEVADRLINEHQAVVVLNGAAKERPLLNHVLAHAKHELIDFQAKNENLGVLMPIIRRASLVLSNDTGSRHMAAALGVPVVTIFGPTDPAWSEINFPWERQIHADIYCRPCQKKKCPLRNTPEDHQCMTMVDVDQVYQAACELLAPHGRSNALVAQGQTDA